MMKFLSLVNNEVKKDHAGKTVTDDGKEMAWCSVVANDSDFKKTYDEMIKNYTGMTDKEIDE